MFSLFRVPSSPGIAKRTRSADKRAAESASTSLFKTVKPEHSLPKKNRITVSESSVSSTDKNKNASTKQGKSDSGQGHKQDIVISTKPAVEREASFESVKNCPVASTSSVAAFKETLKGSKVILSRTDTVFKETSKSAKAKEGKKRKGSGSSVKSETSSLSLVDSASLSSVGSATTYCSGVSGSNLSNLLSCDHHTDTSKSKGRKRRKSGPVARAPSVQTLQGNSVLDTPQAPSTSSETPTPDSSKRSLRSKSEGRKSRKSSSKARSVSLNSDQDLETVEPRKESVIKSVDKKAGFKEASVNLSGSSVTLSIASPVTYSQPPKKRSKWDRQKASNTSVNKETPSTSSAVSPPGRSGLRRKNRSKNTGSCASSR